MCWEGIGHLCGIGPPLPPVGSRDWTQLNSLAHQAPLPTEPSHQPLLSILSFQTETLPFKYRFHPPVPDKLGSIFDL